MKLSKAPAVVGLLAAVALVLAGCASGEAEKRRGEVQPPPKPVKLRYYGGPKSPMYPG
jgi:hypothetical protein